MEGIICASAKDLVYEDPAGGTYAYPGWDEETGWGRVDAFQALMRLRAPYDLQVRSASGYDAADSTGIEYVFGAPGSRNSLVQYRLTKAVSAGFDWFTRPPDAWGLSNMSSGACSLLTGPVPDSVSVAAPDTVSVEFIMGYCKVVKGSVANNACTLKSFCYKWYAEQNGQWVYEGWLPNDPELQGWHYELSGIVMDPLASTAEMVAVTAAQDGVPCFCPAGDLDSLGVSLHLVDNQGSPLEGVPSTDIHVRVHADGRTAHPARFPCPADAESAYVYRPEQFLESAVSGDLFLTLPPMGGHDRWATWTAHVSGVLTGMQQVLEQGVRSVDIDGDGDVDGADFSLFFSGYSTGAWWADLNGDGACGGADFGIFAAHYGHVCDTRGRAGKDAPTESKSTGLTWQLFPNAPNPFSSTTDVTFCVPSSGQRVRIAIYDLAGRLTRVLCDAEYDAGIHVVKWDGRNDQGEEVGSGVYFSRIDAPGFRDRGKLMLLR